LGIEGSLMLKQCVMLFIHYYRNSLTNDS
jgi:hypothetical protein